MTPKSLLSLSIEEKVGQLFVIGLPGTSLDGDALALIEDVRPGGICLFSRNIRDAAQTRELSDAVRESIKVEPILTIDQEGGLVDRLRRLISPMPSAASITTTGSAGRLGRLAAEILRILGFNLNFAPVVDVMAAGRESANNGLFSRTFGRSAVEAADLAGSFLSAMQNGGCLGCLKHFPGLGASAVDSHEALPEVSVGAQELFETDLVPYRAMIDSVSAVMVAHAAYPNVYLQAKDQNGRLLPSSLNENIVAGLLRGEFGFDGVAVTDDLEMGAILKNYGIGEACLLALAAGNDMLAICANPEAIRTGYSAVLDAVARGAISEARIDRSLERIEILKSKLSPALDFDPARLASLSADVDRLKADLK